MKNVKMVAALKKIADAKAVTVSQLALAWVYAKYPFAQSLVGTTSANHLQESVDALKIDLTTEDVIKIEDAFPADKVKGTGMPEFICRNGKLVR